MAMVWHMARNKLDSPLRVALFSALGAGLGFAFGNFLQILGNVLEISFNMWNVMEYSIGFFGGIAMAYGVFTSEWPDESLVPETWENRTALLLTFVFIPIIVFNQSRLYEVISGNSIENMDLNEITFAGSIAAAIIIVAMAVIGWIVTVKSKHSFKRQDVMVLFILYFASYIFISYCVTGAFSGIFMLNHHLYVINFIVVLVLSGQRFPAFFEHHGSDISGTKWLQYFTAIIVIIIILTLILINIHGEMNGANARFPYDPKTPQGGL